MKENLLTILLLHTYRYLLLVIYVVALIIDSRHQVRGKGGYIGSRDQKVLINRSYFILIYRFFLEN